MKRANTSGKASGNGRTAVNKKSSATKSSGNSSRAATSKSSNNGTARGAAGKRASGQPTSKKRGSNPEEDLSKMFEDLLRDTYWAEKNLTKALPKLSKAAESQELKDAFDQHLEETQEQITRLEQVFELCGFRATAKKCEAMEGLLEEGKEVIENYHAGAVRDAALIIAAQKVEHYEIAAYGSLRTLAHVLGEDEAAEHLQITLDEEAETDEKLTQIAMTVNQEAEEGSTTEDDVEDEEEDTDDDTEESEIEMSSEDEEEDVEEDIDEDEREKKGELTSRKR